MDYHLFECVGIELEYMVVDADDLNVRSIVDQLFCFVADSAQPPVDASLAQPSELAFGAIGWSNELARHVLEFKTNGPATSWEGLHEAFSGSVHRANAALANFSAMLMPGATHPWMDPARDGELWPHGQRDIYAAYDRIFDCRGHGWFNLQSMHVNLPFCGDDEFRRLHSAARLILPLIPALAASSPFMAGTSTGELCRRLFVYAQNQRAVPSIAGAVIPRVVTSIQGYHDHILAPMFHDIAAHDPEGLLQDEWLNSHGAIARFDRNAIELRLADIQEAPQFDIAIAFLLTHAMRELCEERFADLDAQEQLSTSELADQLWRCARDASRAQVTLPAWATALGGHAGVTHVGDLLPGLAARARDSGCMPASLAPAIDAVVTDGTLAERMVSYATHAGQGGLDLPARLRLIARELAAALAEGRRFDPRPRSGAGR